MTRTVHTHDTKLAGARPVPGHPAYYVRPDGRVISIKQRDLRILAEQGSPRDRGVWLRVCLDGHLYRVRDLVGLTYGGDLSAFIERAVCTEFVERGAEIHRLEIV